MKTLNKILVLIAIISIAFTACKKKSSSPVGALGANYPYALNNIITPAIIDTFQSHGMAINAGLTPPSANGIYLLSPDYCIFDNSGYNQKGTIFADQAFKFANQNNATSTIDLAYKANGSTGVEVGNGSGLIYITGAGNVFTIYAQSHDTTNNVTSVLVQLISGQIGTGGIVNMQYAFYVESKGNDPTNIVVPLHTTRIFQDKDNLSATQSTFSAIQKQINGTSSLSLFISAAQKPN
jgi:hypothetical protein